MNLKEEMLEAAGISKTRKSIERLILNGAYFDKNLEYDLRVAVQEGIITSNDAYQMRNARKPDNVIDKFFRVYAPMLEEALVNRINYLENEIENSSVLEESEIFMKELDDLRNKQNIIRNLTC